MKMFAVLPVLVALGYLRSSAVVEASPMVNADELPNRDYTSEWTLVKNLTVNGVLPLLKYESKRTGLTVILAQGESPIVNGYFCLATEADNEDGLPHTLEHLIFLGSEDYPYKETLDLMANRCLSSRTNAWTDTDHTCYTVYTAGDEGFLNILPIYMDHIMHPTLRDEDFLTEVHHISGEGEDAGVVYSEMQGVENRPSNILYFTLADAAYPGNSSYEIRTGGALKNLRESTTNEKVKNYHKKFYQPKNLQLLITGTIDTNDVFKALEPVERKLVAKGAFPPLEPRPFSEHYPLLTEDININKSFPTTELSVGRVSMIYRLNQTLVSDIRKLHALNHLGNYLTSTVVSPMSKAFVNIDDPLATGVGFGTVELGDPSVSVSFTNVPVAKIELIEPKFKEEVMKIVNAGPDKLNMDRLHTIIRRKILARKKSLEKGPHSIVPDRVVNDLIYGSDDNDVDELSEFFMDGDESRAVDFISQPAEFWLNLLNDTINVPRVKVQFYPSKELNEEMLKIEEERLTAQKERLGPEGLAEAGRLLDEAVKSKRLPPQSVLESVPVANASNIKFRTLEYFNYTTEKQPENFPLRDIPFKFHLDNIQTQFVKMSLFFDISDVTQEDRPYLPLLTETWLRSPMKIDGKLITLDEVSKRGSEEALSLYNDIGYKGSTFVPGTTSNNMYFYLETMLEKYEEGTDLLKDYLFNVEFDEERTKNLVDQLLNGIPSSKLAATTVVASAYDALYFAPTSNVHHMNYFRQEKFLRGISEQLEKNSTEVMKKLSTMARAVARPEKLFVYMAASLERLEEKYGSKVADPWIDFFAIPEKKGEKFDYPTKEDLAVRFSPDTEWTMVNPEPKERHVIAGIAGTESCYLQQSVPYDNRDWELAEVASMRVMLQYLSDQMYNLIRGKGLTYSIGISGSVTEGRLSLKFYRSSQLVPAYRVWRDIATNFSMMAHADGDAVPWDQTLLDSARGSEIYTWTQREETISSLASVSVKSIIRGTDDPYYNRRFVARVADVTLEDVMAVARKLLPAFLDANKTQTAIVCGPAEIERAVEDFKEYGINLRVLNEDLGEDELFA